MKWPNITKDSPFLTGVRKTCAIPWNCVPNLKFHEFSWNCGITEDDGPINTYSCANSDFPRQGEGKSNWSKYEPSTVFTWKVHLLFFFNMGEVQTVANHLPDTQTVLGLLSKSNAGTDNTTVPVWLDVPPCSCSRCYLHSPLSTHRQRDAQLVDPLVVVFVWYANYLIFFTPMSKALPFPRLSKNLWNLGYAGELCTWYGIFAGLSNSWHC